MFMGYTCWGDGRTPSRGQQALLCLCLCEISQGSRARLVFPISLQSEGGARVRLSPQTISNDSPNASVPRTLTLYLIIPTGSTGVLLASSPRVCADAQEVCTEHR